MIRVRNRLVVGVTAAVLLTVSMVACSDDSSDTAAPSDSTTSAAAASPSASATTADAPFRAAWSAVPPAGPGSLDGMAQAPVATAASNNPVLSTLVKAVTAAGLVDT